MLFIIRGGIMKKSAVKLKSNDISKRIAILCEKQFHDMEVFYPYYRVLEAGHQPVFVGVDDDSYTGKFGYPVKQVDMKIKSAKAKDFDAVIIPGGWAPDFLRLSEHVLKFVKDMNDAKKPVASICHGAWVLCSVPGFLKGRSLTCYKGIRDDVKNAGGIYSDKECVVDNNLITSRTPNDLPTFMKELLSQLE